jgi:hypothetical protein
MMKDGQIRFTKGKYLRDKSDLKAKTKKYGCSVYKGSLFNSEELLKRTEWTKSCDKWFPNTTEVLKSSSGRIKISVQSFDSFTGLINGHNRKFEYSLGVDQINVELRRSVVDGFNSRLYTKGNIHSLPKKDRLKIMIGDMPCCEIDIQGCHIGILARMLRDKGSYPKVSSFDFEDYRYSRDQIKRGFYICINTKNRVMAKKGIERRLKITEEFSCRLIAFIEEYFHEYREFFFRDMWKTLYIEESKITDSVISFCINNKVPVIPIFDSYVVPKANYRIVSSYLDDLGWGHSLST